MTNAVFDATGEAGLYVNDVGLMAVELVCDVGDPKY